MATYRWEAKQSGVLSKSSSSDEALSSDLALHAGWSLFLDDSNDSNNGSSCDGSANCSALRTSENGTDELSHYKPASPVGGGTSSSTPEGKGADGHCWRSSDDPLAPFVMAVGSTTPERGSDDAKARRSFDAETDVPLPCSHAEIVRALAAKHKAESQRAALLLLSPEEAKRPFSRMNRARTTLLLTRSEKSRQRAERARSVSLSARGIDQSLTEELRGLNALEQAQHPRLQAVPLLSRVASLACATKGRNRREMALITKAFGDVDDDDHRVVAVNLQARGLNDTWASLLSSTLLANRTVRAINLNKNSIGDRGVELLAQALLKTSSVEMLSLGGNRLTDEAAKSLARFLRSGRSSLKALNLAGVTPKRLSGRISMTQSESGASDPLPDTCINPPGVAALALSLGDPASSRCQRLVTLNLAFQRVQDAGAIALAAALKSSPCHLEALGLSGAQLTDAAALAFARVLSGGRSHDGLWKSYDRKHHRRNGRQEIHRWNGRASEAVGKGMCTLRRLDLSRNGITDTGARALAAALRKYSDDLTIHRSNGYEQECSADNRDSDEIKSRVPELLLDAHAVNGNKGVQPVARCADLGFLGLDLAHNAVGADGITALSRALLKIPGMIFLELRGNKADRDVGERGSAWGSQDPPFGMVPQEVVERTCAERRMRLRSTRLLERHHVASRISRDAKPASANVSPEPVLEKEGPGATVRGDSCSERTSAKETNRFGWHQSLPPSTDAICPKRSREETEHDGSAGWLHEGQSGKTIIAAGRWRERPSPSSGGHGVVRSRPLEGALPLRGYYTSPLLDSCFDLLMLREPAPDPADPCYYVNQVRGKLEQRRLLRKRLDGDGNDHGAGNTREDGVGRNSRPFPAGSLVSPMELHQQDRQVLVERRCLLSVDSDLAARKHAWLAGQKKLSKARRSKVLTGKHGNAAFTRELMNRESTGVGAKCPSGLRSHFVGLQNFQYDWGGSAK